MFAKDKVKLGIAPINWGNDDLPDLGGTISLEQCLNEVAVSGFQGCEIGHKFPKQIKNITALLKKRNLQIASQWFSAYVLTGDAFDETLDRFVQQLQFLRRLGAKVIVVCECTGCIHSDSNAALTKRPRWSDPQWSIVTAAINDLGHLANLYDMHLVYHPHMGTGVQTLTDIARLMAETEPDKVGLLLDTGHLLYADGVPESVVRKYADRIAHVHLKDIRREQLQQAWLQDWSFLEAVKQGVFTVPGDGSIDFKPIIKSLADNDYRGWLVVEAEQNLEKVNPLNDAKQAHAYLQTLLQG